MSNQPSNGYTSSEPECADLDALEAFEEISDEGTFWFDDEAGAIERKAVLAMIGGWEPMPQERLSDASSVSEIIQEIVFSIHRPSGLHPDSARLYWDLITKKDVRRYQRSFIDYFLKGIYLGAQNAIECRAYETGRAWYENPDNAGRLKAVRKFIAQYGDSWKESYPEGCYRAHDVALLMAGIPGWQVAAFGTRGFEVEFRCGGEFGSETELFARNLIQTVVDLETTRLSQLGLKLITKEGSSDADPLLAAEEDQG